MQYFKQYKSGLRLVAKATDVYTVSLGIFVGVGSVMEDENTNGFSHFIEHLLFKGTPTRTAQQISEEMDNIGANLNAFTSKEVTCYYTKSAAEDIEKCMDVLSDMYLNADIPQEELDRERGVVLEEIKMSEDIPDDVSTDLIAQAVYFDGKIGQTILGKADNIRYCDRHSLLNFKKKHYIPGNTVISVCGKFDFDQLDKMVCKYFDTESEGKVVEYLNPQSGYTNNFLHKIKEIEQAHLQISWPACGIDSSEIHTLAILSNILGGSMSSRLYQAVRERNGLAYSVYSYPSVYKGFGTLDVYMGLSPENVQKACDLVAIEIADILKNGVTETELKRAKVQAVNSLIMGVESTLTLMRLMGNNMLKLSKQYDVARESELYKKVTIEQVNALARKYLTNTFASSYVGPNNDQFDAVSKIRF